MVTRNAKATRQAAARWPILPRYLTERIRAMHTLLYLCSSSPWRFLLVGKAVPMHIGRRQDERRHNAADQSRPIPPTPARFLAGATLFRFPTGPAPDAV